MLACNVLRLKGKIYIFLFVRSFSSIQFSSHLIDVTSRISAIPSCLKNSLILINSISKIKCSFVSTRLPFVCVFSLFCIIILISIASKHFYHYTRWFVCSDAVLVIQKYDTAIDTGDDFFVFVCLIYSNKLVLILPI